MTDLITSRELLIAIPDLSESTLRSLIRRKYIQPTRRGGYFWWSPESVERIKSYLVSRWTA